MRSQGINRCRQAVLSLLLTCGVAASAGLAADKKELPKPLPPDVIKAWSGADAVVGWMKDIPPDPDSGYSYWEPWREEVEAGAIPAFRFPREKGAAVDKLPDPGVAFGLTYRCRAVETDWLKKLAGLKNLKSLNIGGSLTLKDEKLKEVAALKDLQRLYLYYAPVTDTGLNITPLGGSGAVEVGLVARQLNGGNAGFVRLSQSEIRSTSSGCPAT